MVPKASSPRSAAARARHVVEDPGELGRREVGIDKEPGARPHVGLHPLGLEIGAQPRGAPVLPHDGLVDRRARRLVPHHHGLALVGDTDPGDVARRDAALGHGLARGLHHITPDVLRVVLDPAQFRVVLFELALRGCDCARLGVEDDGAGRGRPLVDSK
ncbi:hypothetical protein MBENS4_2027 [Novosphingobium sp. MBES04]|nr:hypothetical protein MBENS4_2027 [Novosphingobium sp. MBES04]